MSGSPRTCLLGCCALLHLTAAPGVGLPQTVALRFGAIDMYGGVVLAEGSEAGVAFGGRLGLFDLFGRRLRAGPELSWWTAPLRGEELEVRDVVGGLAAWRSWRRDRVLRPYLGLGAGLHSVDVTRPDGSRLRPGESPEAARLDGNRIGVSVFAGITVRLTATGAIHSIIEYRYSWISRIMHHEVRVGARLQTGSHRRR